MGNRNNCLRTYKYVAGKSPGCAKSITRHYAVFCVSPFLKLNLKSRPEVFTGPEAKPSPPNQLETDSAWIKQGFTKWLQNSDVMIKDIA